MESNKIAHWIQVVATIGVLIGIGLVILELRQAKAMAEANQIHQFFAEVAQNGRAQMGENPAPILSKACSHSNEITDADLVVLDGFFSTRWALAVRSIRLEQAAEFDTPWRYVTTRVLEPVLRLEHGRQWLHQKAPGELPEFEDLVSKLLAEFENTTCADTKNVFG